MSDLVIHALRVGEGILGLTVIPGIDGRYGDDIAHLHDWQPAIVLCLASDADLMAHGAITLGADLQDMGTRWVSMPVADFAAPGPGAEAAWQSVAAPVRRALAGGGRVLIHGRDDLRRPAMLALRILIEEGAEADAAQARLRRLAPDAVVAPDPLDWARRGQAGTGDPDLPG